MKRIYNLLMLVMAMLFTSNAMAAVQPGLVKTAFSGGDEVFLKSIYAGNKYLAGLSNSETPSEENVYVLEDAGDSQFYLKQKSTDRYIAFGAEGDPGEYATTLSGSTSEAVKFAIEAAKVGTNVDEGKFGSDISLVSVFRVTNMPTGDNINYLSGYAGVSLMPYTDSNPMIVYSAESDDARIELADLLSKYTTTSFKADGGLTSVQQSAIDNFVSAYNAAKTAYNAGKEGSAIQTELDALKAAISEAVNGSVGYVRFISAHTDYTTANTIRDNGTRLTTATFDAAVPEQVWKLTKLESGNYKVQNIVSNMYMNYCDGTSAQVRVATAPEYEIVISEGANAGEEQEYRIKDTKINMQFHRDGGGAVVGWNNDDAGSGSAWFVRPLSEDEVTDMLDLAQYKMLDGRLDSLVAVANTLMSRVGKLVGDKGNIYSNADQNTLAGTDGGGYAALIDGNTSTYWHSCYNNEAAPAENHYLQFTLDEAVQKFMFKYTRRITNNNNRPTDIVISASNDGENFTDITEINEGLPVLATENSYSSETYDMGAPYKYIRFTFMAAESDKKNEDGTISKVEGATANGFPFVTFSEFNVFDPGVVDSYTDAVAALTDAVTVADAIEPLTTTQDDINTLQAAIDAFRNTVVDPTDLQNAIADAETMANVSVGTDPGEYGQADKDAIDAAIAAAKTAATDKNATVASLAAAKDALEAAVATFKAVVPNNTVLPNNWYYIKGSSKAIAYLQGKAMYYDESGNTMFGDLTDENKTDANYQWRLVQLDDTHYAIQNRATGKFIASTAAAADNHATATATNAGRYEVKTLDFGAFNLVEEGQSPIHGQNNGTVIVYWEGGLGSASCWTFDSVETPNTGVNTSVAEGIYESGSYTPVCVPVAITSVSGATMYTLNGKEVNTNGEAIAFNLKEVTSVAAGQPFLLKPSGSNVTFTWGDTGVYNPGSENGLVGTFSAETLASGLGYLNAGTVDVSDGTYNLAAYGAYFNEAKAPISSDGDEFITVNGVLTGIENIASTEAETVNVYTLSGVRVRSNVKASEATTNLPKGIYIVGKKKVAVR